MKQYPFILFFIMCLISHQLTAQQYSNRYTEYKRISNKKSIPFQDTIKLTINTDTSAILRQGNNALGYNGIIYNKKLDVKFKTFDITSNHDNSELILQSDNITHHLKRELKYDNTTYDHIKTELPTPQMAFHDISKYIYRNNWKVFKILDNNGKLYEEDVVLTYNIVHNDDGSTDTITTEKKPTFLSFINEIVIKNGVAQFYSVENVLTPIYTLQNIQGNILTLQDRQGHEKKVECYQYNDEAWIIKDNEYNLYFWIKKRMD